MDYAFATLKKKKKLRTFWSVMTSCASTPVTTVYFLDHSGKAKFHYTSLYDLMCFYSIDTCLLSG